MEFWKDLINLKESKKPSDKFLRVWEKNQLRFEIFEKILKFTCKNYNGKLNFYPFFSLLPGLFHYIHLWNIPKFLGVAWGVLFTGLGGGTFEFGRLYKSLDMPPNYWFRSYVLHWILFIVQLLLREFFIL